MKIYVVKTFNEMDYCNEVVGYYSTQAKAEEAIEEVIVSSEVEQDYWIDEVELDKAIEY